MFFFLKRKKNNIKKHNFKVLEVRGVLRLHTPPPKRISCSARPLRREAPPLGRRAAAPGVAEGKERARRRAESFGGAPAVEGSAASGRSRGGVASMAAALAASSTKVPPLQLPKRSSITPPTLRSHLFLFTSFLQYFSPLISLLDIINMYRACYIFVEKILNTYVDVNLCSFEDLLDQTFNTNYNF